MYVHSEHCVSKDTGSFPLYPMNSSWSSWWTLPSRAAGSHFSCGVSQYVKRPNIVMAPKMTGESKRESAGILLGTMDFLVDVQLNVLAVTGHSIGENNTPAR